MNDKNTKISIFKSSDISELAKVMVENAKNETCSDAILFYDEAAKLIKELLKYDNEISVNSFNQLTYNKNVRYFKHSDNNKIEIKLLDDSNITIIVNEKRGS